MKMKPNFSMMVARALCASLICTLMRSDLAAAPPSPADHVGMVLIPGGEFAMGASGSPGTSLCGGAEPMADAVPVHRVRVRAFWMDRDVVTSAQFTAFVAATGYTTVAELRDRAGQSLSG